MKNQFLILLFLVLFSPLTHSQRPIQVQNFYRDEAVVAFSMKENSNSFKEARPEINEDNVLTDLKRQFTSPPAEFRAFYPFQGACGQSYNDTASMLNQLDKIYNKFEFGGVIIAPTDNKPFVPQNNGTPGFMQHVGSGLQKNLPLGASPWLMILPEGRVPYSSGNNADNTLKPDPLPAYLSKEHFERLRTILAYSKERGRKVIFYDEVGYPSGIANYTTPEKYMRKLLEKEEEVIVGPKQIRKSIPKNGLIMAVVAMNTKTLQRIDLTPLINSKKIIDWKVPKGEWKIMIFNCVTAVPTGGKLDYRRATDYLDTEASQWFVDKVYEPHVIEIGEYFGNTLIQTFFDDVGIFDEERTWTAKFNEKFKQHIGFNPAIYYPALWENIGVETDAARAAFFDTLAELLADGFPKVVADWGLRNKIDVSGHCPGNYDPQPVDMNGDPFKFYRDIPVPMVDVIFAYPTGRDGFKLVSDGAEYYDKPVVAGEVFNSFAPAGKKEGYRRIMELYTRGVNRLQGSGLPLTDVLGGNTTFSEWMGRCSLMLQGGRRVSEIAIFYPIADLLSFYKFDAPEFTKDMRWGTFVPYDNDFLAVGEMLIGEAHRDFTFLHPDHLLSDKLKINGATLEMENEVNHQNFKVLILPGQTVISLKALEKIKDYYENGGVVVATSLLPSKASELTGNEKIATANNRKVQALIQEMFGIDSSKPMPEGVSATKTNSKNGRTVFIRKPDGKLLAQTLSKLNIDTDVRFEGNVTQMSGGGMFSYIHKQKDDRDIYYFANSSDDRIETIAEVRGKIIPELWNPATGETAPIKEVEHLKKSGQDYTRFPLKLMGVSSTFVVSAN